MTQEEIIEGNKLIAEFMDAKPSDYGKPWKKWMYSELEYHSSWDWLMPCIGKISNECEEPEELDGLKYALLCNDIDTAWRFVVDYLTSSS